MEISTKPFLCPFLSEKHDSGHILGTRDFKSGFWGARMRGADIENEDAVQHPRFPLCITFEVFAGGL